MATDIEWRREALAVTVWHNSRLRCLAEGEEPDRSERSPFGPSDHAPERCASRPAVLHSRSLTTMSSYPSRRLEI